MPQDLYHYEQMVERALRGVVREALERAAKDGLRGAHHFYIGFSTRAPGVSIPDSLRERYPEEMTIVLQHQYWNLEIGREAFSVTLSFQRQLERLTVPFAAVRSFADPSVNFALEFAVPEAKAPAEKPVSAAASPKAAPGVPAPIPASAARAAPAPAAASEEKAKSAEKPTAEVVTLDSFRKR
jgi:uncharacterized protein